MTHFASFSTLMTVMLLFWFHPVLAAMEIVPVHHRLPAELAEILTPLLDQGEVVVPLPEGLALKAGPKRIQVLRQLVERIDRAPRNLVLTVLQGRGEVLEPFGEGRDLPPWPPEEPGHTDGHVYRTAPKDGATARQRIRVLEGRPAFISVGEERPVPVISLYGFPPQAVGGIRYRAATTGFRVVPHLLGCQVQLTVVPWSRRVNGGNGGFDVSAAATTVVVTPGIWIELGADFADGEGRWYEPTGRGYRTRNGPRRIFLRADSVEGC